MNVYSCCYRGTIGYSCRTRGRNWMFVPEFGQPDTRVHRGVALDDLVFADPRAKSWELGRDARGSSLLRMLNLLGGREESRSVGGMLFTPG